MQVYTKTELLGLGLECIVKKEISKPFEFLLPSEIDNAKSIIRNLLADNNLNIYGNNWILLDEDNKKYIGWTKQKVTNRKDIPSDFEWISGSSINNFRLENDNYKDFVECKIKECQQEIDDGFLSGLFDVNQVIQKYKKEAKNNEVVIVDYYIENINGFNPALIINCCIYKNK